VPDAAGRHEVSIRVDAPGIVPHTTRSVEVVAGPVRTSRNARRFLAATYATSSPEKPLRTQPSAHLVLEVEATNTGEAVWLTRARRERGVVKLAWRWWQNGRAVGDREGRLHVEHDVYPGQAYRFRPHVEAPPVPGRYVLELGLVSEYITWFADVGTPPIWLPVEVHSPG